MKCIFQFLLASKVSIQTGKNRRPKKVKFLRLQNNISSLNQKI